MAVLTQDSILIYDTVHAAPLAVMRGLHYANLTKAVWSADGHSLVVSSTDGYVTLVRFAPGELGDVYKHPVEEEVVTEIATPEPAATCTVSLAPTSNVVIPPCEQGTVTVLEGRPAKKAKRITPTQIAPTCIKRKTEEIAVPSVEDLSLVEPKKKKRIQPVLVASSTSGNLL